MIELNIELYCQNCKEFEACVEKEEIFGFEQIIHETKISCVHKKRCEDIIRFLKGQNK